MGLFFFIVSIKIFCKFVNIFSVVDWYSSMLME